MKTCTKCGEAKLPDEFHRDRGRADGRDPWCKQCKASRRREYLADPVNAARHVERQREARRRYRSTTSGREKEQELLRCYREDACEVVAAQAAVGGARRRDVRFAELVSPLVVLELHDGVCGVCGEDVDPLDYDLDHIVPIALGGFHTLENLQPAHRVCNSRKGSALQEAA